MRGLSWQGNLNTVNPLRPKIIDNQKIRNQKIRKTEIRNQKIRKQKTEKLETT
jgi:hypothetical protein